MPIISSEVIDDRVINGVRVVEMRFVDEAGRACYCSQQAEPTEDVAATMLARVPAMEAQFVELAKSQIQPVVPDTVPAPIHADLFGEGPPNVEAPDGLTYLDMTEIWERRDGKWKRRGKS